MEVFSREVLDSRLTVIRQGPFDPTWQPSGELAALFEEDDIPWMRRPSKTVLRLGRAHTGAFRELGESDPPRATGEQQAYWASSLCEMHLPVINELIQRYRLVTYDYFAFEVSA